MKGDTMLLAMRRAARPLPSVALLRAHAPRSISAAASSALDTALQRHNIPLDSVPAGADESVVLRQLRFLETIGVPDVARTVQRDPSVLTLDTDAIAGKQLQYLFSLGISRVGPMITEAPQLLSCDLTQDLHKKVSILQALGVQKIGPVSYTHLTLPTILLV